MKKAILILATLLSLGACSSAPSALSESRSIAITLSFPSKQVDMEEDETYQLAPTTNSKKNISYKSLNEDICIVSGMGLLLAKEVGEADILASVEGVSETIKVVVKAAKSNGSIVLTKSSAIGEVGKTYQIEATSAFSFIYESNDEKVLTVNDSGLVTFLSEGNASVLVKDGESVAQVSFDIYTSAIKTASDWLSFLSEGQSETKRFYLANDIDFANVAYEAKVVDTDFHKLGYACEVNGFGHRLKNIDLRKNKKQCLIGTIMGAYLHEIAFDNVQATAPLGLAPTIYGFLPVNGDYGHWNGVDNTRTKIHNIEIRYSLEEVDYFYGLADWLYGGEVNNVFISVSSQKELDISSWSALANQIVHYHVLTLSDYLVYGDKNVPNRMYDQTQGKALTLENALISRGKMDVIYNAITSFPRDLWTLTLDALPQLKPTL